MERPDIGVWELLARAWKLYYELKEESLKAAEKLLRKAVASAPTSCQAHWLFSGVLYHQVILGYSLDDDAIISESYEFLSGVLKLQQTWRDESVGFYSASSSSNILDL